MDRFISDVGENEQGVLMELTYSRLMLVVTLSSSSTRIFRWRNTLMLMASSVVASINLDNYGPSANRWRSMLHNLHKCNVLGRCIHSQLSRLLQRHPQWSQRRGYPKLQSVLHAAARLLTGIRRNDRDITPTLRDVLHWLPVKQRITCKIATMAFSCVRGTCPAYFSDVCTPVQTVAGRAKLRSAHHGHLIVPATKWRHLAVVAFALLRRCPYCLEQFTN